MVVEAGDEMLPGTGLELLRAPLTFPLSEEFRQSLQRTHLETLRSILRYFLSCLGNTDTDLLPGQLTPDIPAAPQQTSAVSST